MYRPPRSNSRLAAAFTSSGSSPAPPDARRASSSPSCSNRRAAAKVASASSLPVHVPPTSRLAAAITLSGSELAPPDTRRASSSPRRGNRRAEAKVACAPSLPLLGKAEAVASLKRPPVLSTAAAHQRAVHEQAQEPAPSARGPGRQATIAVVEVRKPSATSCPSLWTQHEADAPKAARALLLDPVPRRALEHA